MRLFSRGTDVEIQDLRVGLIRVRVRENIIDRMAGFFSPDWKLRRLQARAALDGAPASAVPPGRRTISRGYKPPPRTVNGPWAGGRGFDNMVDDYQAGNRCSRGAAIRAVATEHPEAHARYVKELNG